MTDPLEFRAYLDHLRLEHMHLDGSVREIEPLIIEFRSRRSEVPGRLRELQNRLLGHFESEEEGGCLEEAIARNPAVAPAVSQATQEHAGLLEEIAQLCELAEADRWSELAASFRDFQQHLKQHEAQEDRILERAFNVCLE